MHDSQHTFLLKIFTLMLLLLVCIPSVHAAEEILSPYPEKEITLTIPNAKGSQTDTLIATLDPFLHNYSNFPMTTKHLPGRGGSYAWHDLLDKPGDGYALSVVNLPTFHLIGYTKNRLYDAAALAPVTVFAHVANALWVATDSPFHSVDDLVQYARLPGNSLLLAGVGNYTEHHMATLKFDRAAGVTSVYFPFMGTVEAANAVKEKKATACWGYALAQETMPGMRALAVAASERSTVLPETPTFNEQRVEFVNGLYVGICMPGTANPQERQMVADFFQRVTTEEGFREALKAQGFSPVAVPYQNMTAFLANQRQKVMDFLVEYPLLPDAYKLMEEEQTPAEPTSGQPVDTAPPAPAKAQ